MIDNQAYSALARVGAKSMNSRIWAHLEGVDMILANLEVSITNGLYFREDKRYNFKTSYEILGLFDKRFALCLANNHILDYGEKGLLDTIAALDSRNIPHAGAGRNLDEARRPAIIDVIGEKVGFICAADPRFQPATKTSAGTFPAKPELLRETIQEVRKEAELIVVSIHAGTEFISVPSPNQLRLAELCLEEGARVVSFHHTHCISGIMQDERGVVFFGTGNYVFTYTISVGFSPRKESAVWRVVLNTLSQNMEHVDVLPVILDDAGFPVKPTDRESRIILNRIQKYSYRIRQEKYLRWWRIWEMIRPFYIWLSIVHYADIGRRQGFFPLLKVLFGGMKAQFTRRPF